MKKTILRRMLILALVALTLLSATLPALALGGSSTLAKKGAKYYVYCRNLNFRDGPSMNSRVIRMIPRRTKVMFLKVVHGWWYVRLANGRRGYVDKQFLTPEHVLKPDFYRTKKAVALRAAPKTSAKKLLVIKEDNWPRIDAVNGDWGHTTWKGKSGWIALKYIE